MKRRKFLIGALGVAALAAVGAVTFGRSGIEAAVVSVLRKRLSFLRINEEGLHAFASDQATRVINKRVSLNRLRYHLVSAVGSSFQRYETSSVHRSRIERAEDLLVSTFLLSSDFFTNGADETREVKYIAYYDALRPCNNPFARPALDTATA